MTPNIDRLIVQLEHRTKRLFDRHDGAPPLFDELVVFEMLWNFINMMKFHHDIVRVSALYLKSRERYGETP